MIFFTNDLHLGRREIINLCNRPFSTAEEMDDKELIGMDCGAYSERKDSRSSRRGRLVCLRLNDMREFYPEEMERDEDDGKTQDSPR